MGMLDDIAVFSAVVQQGGFSHAAKHLGLSNGLISRRIAKLEADLGVSLLKRTTRQLQLTPEGEVLWQHAKQIQEEMDKALCVIHTLSDKPKGEIRLSAPTYFGRHHLIPLLNQFSDNFPDIHIDLYLTDQQLDPIRHNIDLIFRGAGYFDASMKDSSLKTKLLIKEPIHLFATVDYLVAHGVPASPDALKNHVIIGHADITQQASQETWQYTCKGKKGAITLTPTWRISETEGRLAVCKGSRGIGKFSAFVMLEDESSIKCVLPEYDWGHVHIYAIYADQRSLPKRTRLLLDFISARFKGLEKK